MGLREGKPVRLRLLGLCGQRTDKKFAVIVSSGVHARALKRSFVLPPWVTVPELPALFSASGFSELIVSENAVYRISADTEGNTVYCNVEIVLASSSKR